MIEKRRFVRIHYPIKVRYRLKGKGRQEGEAFSKNLGGVGICLFLRDRFSVGSVLKLALDLPGSQNPIETEAEVIWVDKAEKKEDGTLANFEAGLKFVSIASAAKASLISFIYESVKRRRRKVSLLAPLRKSS